jgi:DNA-binding transcriptional ArsR family regulator
MERQVNWHAVAEAAMHPTQVAIVAALGTRRASPKELAEEIGEPLGNVAHHVTKLREAKILRSAGEGRGARGAVVHFVRVDTRMLEPIEVIA